MKFSQTDGIQYVTQNKWMLAYPYHRVFGHKHICTYCPFIFFFFAIIVMNLGIISVFHTHLGGNRRLGASLIHRCAPCRGLLYWRSSWFGKNPSCSSRTHRRWGRWCLHTGLCSSSRCWFGSVLIAHRFPERITRQLRRPLYDGWQEGGFFWAPGSSCRLCLPLATSLLLVLSAVHPAVTGGAMHTGAHGGLDRGLVNGLWLGILCPLSFWNYF